MLDNRQSRLIFMTISQIHTSQDLEILEIKCVQPIACSNEFMVSQYTRTNIIGDEV